MEHLQSPVTAGLPATAPNFDSTVDTGAFALSLLRAMDAFPQNGVLATHSISLALQMLLWGTAGKTADELRSVLFSTADPLAHVPTVEPTEATLTSANRIFSDHHFPPKEKYRETIQKHLGATSETLDFSGSPEESARMINVWVEKATSGKIHRVLPLGAITSQTVLVLANAFYLSAKWEHSFDPIMTDPAPFHLLSGQTVEIPMMAQGEEHRHFADEEVTVVELAFRGGDLVMDVVLPNDPKRLRDSCPADIVQLRSWLSQLRPRKVNLWLPKFRLTPEPCLLKSALVRLGAARMFDPAQADLSNMFDVSAAVDDVAHQVDLTVNEKGLEVAAATAVYATLCMHEEPPVRVVVDRPFFFCVRHVPTNAILLLGHITDPRG